MDESCARQARGTCLRRTSARRSSSRGGLAQVYVARTLPFEFPVESDAVLLDKRGQVRAVFIVAYWDNARNSDSKFYRTRTEYAEAWAARTRHGAVFASSLQVFTVLYGTRDGWKAQVLEDLREQCPPLIFLPDLLSANALSVLIESAFGHYLERWESGHADARDAVEQEVAARALTAAERQLARAIWPLLTTPLETPQRERSLRSLVTVRLPQAPVQTRYRQAISVLSVFGAGEVEEWHARQRIADGVCEAFARRAFFLGLGSFSVSKSITSRLVVGFTLRRPFGADGRYEPHRPDFAGWLNMELPDLSWILRAHRRRTRRPTSVPFAEVLSTK